MGESQIEEDENYEHNNENANVQTLGTARNYNQELLDYYDKKEKENNKRNNKIVNKILKELEKQKEINSKDKELNLKEKELNLREKELNLKEKELLK